MNRARLHVVRASRRGLLSSTLRGPRAKNPSVLSPITQFGPVFCPVLQRAPLSVSSKLNKGLMPESDDPPPKELETETPVSVTPAEITESEYHELADAYMESILSKFEELQDEREDVEVEYAAGVLTFTYPEVGTYVINKQPPNKQIWLSSPKSGPKRYDWVVIGDGQDQKEGTAAGDWVYVRDSSSLSDLFLDEIGVDLSMESSYGE